MSGICIRGVKYSIQVMLIDIVGSARSRGNRIAKKGIAFNAKPDTGLRQYHYKKEILLNNGIHVCRKTNISICDIKRVSADYTEAITFLITLSYIASYCGTILSM